MKKIVILVLCCMILSGCGTYETYRQSRRNTAVWTSYGYKYYDYEIEFISEPAGARIEVDNNYIGDAPCRQVYNGQQGLLTTTVITAYPIYEGHYTQTKVIYGNQQMPHKIYFDMRLKRVPQEYDIRLR